MIKRIMFSGIICAVIFTAIVCSNKPLLKETGNIQLPAFPSRDKSIVYIFRPSNVRGNYRHDIFVDNAVDIENFVGYNMGKQYIYFYLTPGKHRIHSHAENGAWIDIFARGGKAYFVEQLAQRGRSQGRNSMKFINETSAKRWVKNLKLGKIVRKHH